MPTLNESTALGDATPRRANTSTACVVPMPPGVSGSVVASPPTTSTVSTVSHVTGMWKARRKKPIVAIRNPHESACHETTWVKYSCRFPRIAKPELDPLLEGDDVLGRPHGEGHDARAATPIRKIAVSCRCSAAYDQSKAGMRGRSGIPGSSPSWTAASEHADADDEVEERLDEERGRERGVGRPVDAVLRDVELHDVAAAGGRDRVHADAGPVRAEDVAEGHAGLRIRGADDVLPGAHARRQPEDVHEAAQEERAPADGRDVTPESLDGIGEGADVVHMN